MRKILTFISIFFIGLSPSLGMALSVSVPFEKEVKDAGMFFEMTENVLNIRVERK